MDAHGVRSAASWEPANIAPAPDRGSLACHSASESVISRNGILTRTPRPRSGMTSRLPPHRVARRAHRPRICRPGRGAIPAPVVPTRIRICRCLLPRRAERRRQPPIVARPPGRACEIRSRGVRRHHRPVRAAGAPPASTVLDRRRPPRQPRIRVPKASTTNCRGRFPRGRNSVTTRCHPPNSAIPSAGARPPVPASDPGARLRPKTARRCNCRPRWLPLRRRKIAPCSPRSGGRFSASS